jgi:hypothetical protein
VRGKPPWCVFTGPAVIYGIHGIAGLGRIRRKISVFAVWQLDVDFPAGGM